MHRRGPLLRANAAAAAISTTTTTPPPPPPPPPPTPWLQPPSQTTASPPKPYTSPETLYLGLLTARPVLEGTPFQPENRQKKRVGGLQLPTLAIEVANHQQVQ
jgi:hypothetical protein